MSEPRDLEEYTRLFNERTEVTGVGFEVTQHMACPFCAHPDFMLLQPAAGILDDKPTVADVMAEEHTCSNCGRSGKSLVERSAGGMRFEFVQTGGPPAPSWLIPAPRRVDGDD